MERTAATRYLLLYNLAMTIGWTVVLLRLLYAVISGNPVYESVDIPLKLFQTGAVLEVLHSATGIIRAPVVTTIFQVSSRLFLLWGVSHPIPFVRSIPSFKTMVLAWSLTEIPRYFYFFIAALLPAVPFWLTVTRYSTFIPLYPLGAGSEWLTLYRALPLIHQSHIFSITMPNRYNFAFDYYICCVIILALYIPGLPFMYSHMIRQRRKYVTTPTAKLGKMQ